MRRKPKYFFYKGILDFQSQSGQLTKELFAKKHPEKILSWVNCGLKEFRKFFAALMQQFESSRVSGKELLSYKIDSCLFFKRKGKRKHYIDKNVQSALVS